MKDTKALSTNPTLYHDSDHFQEEKTEYNEEKDMQNT